MKEKIAYQNGIVVGNVVDKSKLKNPISKLLVQRFDAILFKLISECQPRSIHEIGCGEGRITQKLGRDYQIPIRASDLSAVHIEKLCALNRPNVHAVQRSIYKLKAPEDQADLVICCEVLEHLEDPQLAMAVLKNIGAQAFIFSVPREPVWRILNMLRGKYLMDKGNTPGHLNHWSRKTFLHFLKNCGFRLSSVYCPLPWTMVKGHFAT